MSANAGPGANTGSLRHAAPWLALLTIGALLGSMWFLRVRESAPALPALPGLVVLPLHAAGNGSSEQVLRAEGISRDLIAALAHAENLQLVAWDSAARAQAEKFDLAQLAARLGVSFTLAGSLREADDHLLLELRLSSVPDGRMLWAQTYTRQRDELRALEREATLAVAEALGRPLRDDAPAAPGGAPAVEYLNARHLLAARDRVHAIEVLRALLARTPGDAPAQAALARALAATLRPGTLEQGDIDAISAAATHALAADAQLADAHVAQAVLACRRGDWQICLPEFQRALKLDPADTDSRVTYAYWLAGLGFVQPALAEVEAAWSADPLSYDTNFARARLLDTSGRHDEALIYLNAATPPSPGLVYARWHNAVWRHDLAAAREYAAAMPQSDGFRESYAGITEALADPSRWPQIQPMIGTSERANGRINVLRILMPSADYRVEIAGLERMLRDNWPSYYLLLWMPEYAALRHDPAFGDFLARTHIIDYWRAQGFPAQCRASGDGARCD